MKTTTEQDTIPLLDELEYYVLPKRDIEMAISILERMVYKDVQIPMLILENARKLIIDDHIDAEHPELQDKPDEVLAPVE